MKARLLGPRMALAEGCTAISKDDSSLTDSMRRDTSTSVLNTISLPRMELYDSPARKYWPACQSVKEKRSFPTAPCACLGRIAKMKWHWQHFLLLSASAFSSAFIAN